MENQKSGYIPLYRSVLKQAWAKDVYLRTLWENLLLNAARKPFMARFKGHDWHLQPGQLVVTAADLGLQLCDRKGNPASRDAVERMLAVFVREGMITIEGEKQKGRVITITNYSEYAQKNDDLPAHKAAHGAEHTSAHGDTSNGAALKVVAAHDCAHGAAHTSAQHEQEGNNKNINNSTSENSDESSDKPGKKPPVIKPEAAIQSGTKWGNSEDLRCAEWLFTMVQSISPSAKKPNYASWANDIRLMRERDDRTHYEIAALFKWACNDKFWKGNVLCPATLRDKWTQLDIKRNKQQTGEEPAKPDLDFNNTDWAYEVIR
ncbi:TPA: replication protein [Enterobacter hormaechei]|uniref:replication protein n=1 Tax=Enterobacter hormaechei TaxID=158836 RepID=UPI000528723B|nr:replication protein [Enterobacter hormaechei]KJP72584.1 replication protein [Enterobacter hormaechei subsp. steigerwaltii]HAS1295310.1 replication protein [Enterobacter hormaechei]HAS1343103.1 replication protein [Enterobacter hormaechei]HAS1432722.1 replication protein [Enterobacter hormaechei]HAT7700246.1 replication protein [Enterobacter hormaechei]